LNYTPTGGASTAIVLLPGGIFQYFQTAETAGGITAVSLTATSALSCEVHGGAMNTPGGSPITIKGLILKVQAALQNRSDVDETQTNPEMRPSAWIRDALREITESQPFEELRTSGPLVNIGPGLGLNGSSYAYAVSYFLNSGDDYTMTEDPVIFLSPVQAASVGLVTNGGGAYGMDYMTPKAIQPLLFIPGGIPFKYTRFGNQFWFGTQPGQNYQVYLPYQMRHPFNDENSRKLSDSRSAELAGHRGVCGRGARGGGESLERPSHLPAQSFVRRSKVATE